MGSCSAIGCTNSSNKGFLLKKFPKDPKRRREWVINIGRGNWKPTVSAAVCEVHFEPHMWAKEREDGYRRLKMSAVPTLSSRNEMKKNVKPEKEGGFSEFEPHSGPGETKKPKYRSSLGVNPCSSDSKATNHNFTMQSDQECSVKSEPDSPTHSDEDLHENFTQDEDSYFPSLRNRDENVDPFWKNGLKTFLKEQRSLNDECNENDESTDQNIYDNFQLPQILNTNEKLFHFTGADYDILRKYHNSIRTIIENKSDIYDQHNIELQLILVLCKLKQNLSFPCLALLFNMTETTCQQVFSSMVGILAKSIKPAIYWPTKQEILQEMPRCFESYKSTRVVLDIFEVTIEDCRAPSNSLSRSDTLKYLIGMTPSGLISYLSRGYDGQSSNKTIFNSEKIIDKISPHDAVMVDKVIPVEKECEQKFIKLIKPAFLFPQVEPKQKIASDMGKIARARARIDLAVQRMNSFQILKEHLPSYLVPHIDDIMVVIAATVNLSASTFIYNTSKTCQY